VINVAEGAWIQTLREIKTLFMAHHVNIMRLSEVVTGRYLRYFPTVAGLLISLSSTYLVLEYAPFVLYDVLQAEVRLSLAQIRGIMRGLFSGLAHLHHIWIVHRYCRSASEGVDFSSSNQC